MPDLRPSPPPGRVPGGRTRPSRRVDLSDHPTLRLRRALDRRVALRCAVGADGQPRSFTPEEVELLLLITQERFDDDDRREAAVAALAEAGTARAIDRLMQLAANPLEDDGVRLRAVAGLPEPELRRVATLVDDDPSAVLSDYVGRRLAELDRPSITDEEPGDR